MFTGGGGAQLRAWKAFGGGLAVSRQPWRVKTTWTCHLMTLWKRRSWQNLAELRQDERMEVMEEVTALVTSFLLETTTNARVYMIG